VNAEVRPDPTRFSLHSPFKYQISPTTPGHHHATPATISDTPTMAECATAFGQLERLSGKSRLIGSVCLEAMITIARYGRTTRPRPQREIAMTVLFVVNIPTA
jgi:hypothetical protein